MASERKPKGFLGALELLGAGCASLLMLILVLITFTDVIGRQIGYPLSFAFEFTQVTVGVMFYIALPLVTFRHEHIVVDLVPFEHGGGLDRAAGVFVDVLSTFLVAMAARQLWVQAETLEMFNTVMMFTRWPVAPFVYFMSGLAGVTAVVLLCQSFAGVREIFRLTRSTS